jgi:hypothetical protein
MVGSKTVRKNLGNLELNMITKRIDNIPAEEWPWIMGNIVSIFTIETSTPTSITATGQEDIWDKIYIPDSATVTVVE